MANDPLPADPDGFDRFCESSPASMAPDLYPAFLHEIMHQIEAWRQRQADPLSRPEAIRRLIELGLTAQSQPAPAAPGWVVVNPAPAPITPTKAEEVR